MRVEMAQDDVGESCCAEPITRAGSGYIACSGAGAQRRRDSSLDGTGRPVGTEAVAQQHGRAQDRAAWIGHSLARDIWSGAMNRLVQAGA